MPNLPTLFDELTGPAGYRLKLLEVFNRGTFHEGSEKKDSWRLVPDGQNTLLTGANGSGKTTLVDGLLALLVNPAKRFSTNRRGPAAPATAARIPTWRATTAAPRARSSKARGSKSCAPSGPKPTPSSSACLPMPRPSP
ncbi:MAG: hypothetical protein EOO56_22275 [Hymenobacter sp.]|nr:MAG: hypothetical protein EOO56_22275 [Hymenobacter sp.]